MSHKDELMRKVKRGEMTRERALAELGQAYFDEHDFNPEYGYAIHSMDQIPEVHDPHTLFTAKTQMSDRCSRRECWIALWEHSV